MPLNCGLSALEKIVDLKNVSAFTLVHLGRDNGLNLFFFKVNDLADLPRVQRPAIFHQKDHFVYVKNGEAMPDGEYTGHVIGSQVLGGHCRILSMAEAKVITGGKNFLTGENKDGVKEGGGALGSILSVVGAVVGTLILPGVGTALGASLSAGAGGAIGGAIGGGVGSAITGDNPYLGAGLGALGGVGIGGGIAGAGAASTAQGATLGSKIAGFGQGAFNSLSHPIASLGAGGNAIATGGIQSAATQAAAFGGATALPSNTAAYAAGGGASGLASGLSNAVGSAVGSGSAAAVNPIFQSTANSFTPASGFSLSSFPSLSTSAPAASSGGTSGASVGSSGAGSAATGASSLLNGVNPVLAGAGLIGTLGSKTPTMEGSATGNYSAAKTFLGDTAYKQLETPTSNTLLSYINTPIADLQNQFTQNNQRTLNTINTAYDNQKAQLVHQYAQAGQNLANSSELQDKVGQLEQKRTNDLTLAQQELTDQALGQAIQVKQQALSSSLQQGQYDSNTAMDLAKLIGEDQVLAHAIATNDYQTFQGVMGKILTAGLPNQGIGNVSLKLA